MQDFAEIIRQWALALWRALLDFLAGWFSSPP